jgi:hypothetical protein
VGKRLIALLAALAALAMIVAGCGGDGDSTDSLTKAEFVKQGNAICVEGEKKLEAEIEEFFEGEKQPTKVQLEEAANAVFLPSLRKQVGEIRDLGLPSEGAGEADKALKAAEEALKKGEEDPSILLVQGPGPFAEATKLAKEFGLTKCAEE